MNFFTTFSNRMNQFSSDRKAINQLRALSDRELADMGLTRGMISHAVRDGLTRR